MSTQHLQRWHALVNYDGIDYDTYYIAAARMYSCSRIERDEFAHVRESLKDCGARGVIDVTCSDELLHARYYVLVHEDSARAMKMAEMFAARRHNKGYILPEEDAGDGAFESRVRELMSPAPVTGHFSLIPETGSTITHVRKKQISSRHEAAIRRVIAETEALTGAPVKRISRSIDGIRRRWDGVKNHGPSE